MGVTVLTEFLDGFERLPNHLAVVLGVASAFFLLQAVLSLRLYVRTMRQDRILHRLSGDLRRGGDGRRDPDALPWTFDWLQWVLSVFPAKAATPAARFTRDEALHELDTRIASDASYLLLQRMGIMAPLLGVVLTVVGFYWLKIDGSSEQSLQTILMSVTPLVTGVGAGAILALINQALLQVVGGRLERLRMSARTWFDSAIWRHIGRNVQGATVTAVAAVERFAGAMATSADRHATSSGRIEASTAALEHAAAQFAAVVRSFHGEMEGIPQALCVLRDATAASARALQELIPIGVRAVSNLDVSVAAFRTTIDREFTEAVQLQHRSSKSLANSVGQIGDSTELLKTGADDLKHTAAANVASFARIDESLSGVASGLASASERLRRTLESDMAPSQQTLRSATSSFAQSAEKLSTFVEQGLGPATRELASLHDTLVGLHGTIDAIRTFSESRDDIDRLTTTLARAAEVADAISSLPLQIRGMLEQNAAQPADVGAERSRKIWQVGRPR
jgi:hypothetical protein